MSRNLTSAMATAMAASNVRPILLFKAEFATSSIYFWTGIGDLSWDGLTWQGIGSLIECSPIDETDDVKAGGVSIRVSGVPSSMVSLALSEMRSGKSASIYLGLLDGSEAIIADPKIIFKGRLDICEVDETNPEAPLITLQYENELVDLERPREWRYTHEHQQILYAGDLGLEFIPGLADKMVYWGRSG